MLKPLALSEVSSSTARSWSRVMLTATAKRVKTSRRAVWSQRRQLPFHHISRSEAHKSLGWRLPFIIESDQTIITSRCRDSRSTSRYGSLFVAQHQIANVVQSSAILANVVLLRAYYERPNFYSAAVHISQSTGSLMVSHSNTQDKTSS
jgi:hypothetical protein